MGFGAGGAPRLVVQASQRTQAVISIREPTGLPLKYPEPVLWIEEDPTGPCPASGQGRAVSTNQESILSRVPVHTQGVCTVGQNLEALALLLSPNATLVWTAPWDQSTNWEKAEKKKPNLPPLTASRADSQKGMWTIPRTGGVIYNLL